jgi:Repeat of unknown function (DUF346)/Quinohemoprotein amine dehydrogenase, alpha subunit domain III
VRTRSFSALLAAIAATLLVGIVGVQPAAAAPNVTSISPTSFGQGATNVDLIVNGSGFDSSLGGPNVTISGTGITVNNTQMNSGVKLTANLTIATNAPLGTRTVTVSQGPGGVQTSSCTNCLTINAGPTISGPPVPASYSNNGNPSSTLVKLTGTNFVAGATLKLVRPSQDFPDIVATGVTVSNGGTKLQGTIDFAGQPATKWKVVVVNPDFGQATFGDGVTTGFTIGGGSPTISDVQPSSRGQGTTGTVLTLTGTNFARGGVVTFSPNVSEITTSNPTWVNNQTFQVTIDISATATPAVARDVTFTNFDSQADTCSECFTVNAKPTITNANPSSRGQGATNETVVVTGSGFQATPTVTFSGTGVTLHSPVTFDNSGQLTLHVDVAAAATASARTLTVTNPDGGSATTTFTVNPAPTVTSATPASRGQNASNQDISIVGTNFVTTGPNTPAVAISGTGVTVNSTTWVDAQHVTANVTVANNAATTARNVTVTNPDDGVGTGTNVFTVNAGPTIMNLSPNALSRNVSHKTVVVNGGGFVATPTVQFFNGADLDTNITVHSVVRDSATHLTLDVSVGNGDTAGARDVKVTNPDQGNVTASGAFTVDDPPTLTNVQPSSIGQGAVAQDLTVTGTNFQSTPTVAFSGTGITVDNVVRTDAQHLTVTVDVAGNAAATARDVTVTNPDFGSATDTGALTVTAGPHITSITPSSASNSGSVNITNLSGSGFASNAVVTLVRNGFNPVTMTGTTVTGGGTKITGSFALNTAGAGGTRVAPGAWTVRVTNPDDNGQASLVDGFTVTANAPTVTGTYTVGPGVNTVLQVSGTNFADGSAGTFSGTGVTVNSSTDVSATRVDVNISVAANATPGPRDITITNADGQSGTCTGCLVISNSPTITTVTPSARGQGTSHKSVVIAGANYDANPVVSFSGTGITINTTTRDSANQITLDISIASNATTGARDVTVTNSDGGHVTKVGGFTVTAAPTVSSLNPNARGQGTTHQPVQVNGTGFDSAPTVAFSGSGITVNSVTRNSATLLTLDVSIDPSASTDARTVTVTNADGGVGSLDSAFTVTAKPSVSSTNPNSRGAGGTHQLVQVNGTGFDTAPAVTFSGTGITVHSVTRNSAILLTVDLSIDPAATPSARDVTVTNADGGIGTLPSGFTVTAPPTTSSAQPNSMVQGATGNVQLNGANYVTTPTVVFSGSGITVNNVTRNSSVQLTVNITVAANAATGARNVTVTNPDQGTTTANGIFTVTGTDNGQLPFQLVSGSILGSPAVTTNAPNTVLVYSTSAANGSIQGRANFGSGWVGPVNYGGVGVDGPGATNRGSTIDLFVQGSDHALYVNECGNACSGWSSLGGGITGSPAAVSWDTTRTDVFVRGSDNALYQKFWSNGSWSNYVSLGGVLASSPTVTSPAPNRLIVAARGTDGAVWIQTWNGTAWSGWSSAGGQIKGQPALVAQPGNRVDLFVQGLDNQVWHSRNFGAFAAAGGLVSSGPAATYVTTNSGDQVAVAVRGADTNLYVAERAYP